MFPVDTLKVGPHYKTTKFHALTVRRPASKS